MENENFLKIRERDIYFDDYELNKGNDNEGGRPINVNVQFLRSLLQNEENLNLKGRPASVAEAPSPVSPIVPSAISWNFHREIARYSILENCAILFFCI